MVPESDTRSQSQEQSKPRRREREVEDLAPADSSHKAELDSEVDSLLDEIDDVLEVNAEEFVRSFVQKGGPVSDRSASVS